MTIRSLLIRLGISDALVRGTALTANLLMGSIVATTSGFGTDGILKSAFIQLTITGLLEIPSGLFSDHSGWFRAVRIGLWLKVATTISFGAAVVAADGGLGKLAWSLIAAEAIADAFANSMINGAYQAGYQAWFERSARNVVLNEPECSHPFLASFRYGLPIRIGLPIGLVLLALGLRQFRPVGTLAFSLSLLCVLLVLRFLVIWTVERDLGVRSSVDLDQVPARKGHAGIGEIIRALRYSPRTILCYGYFSFLIASLGSYLIAQSYGLLERMNLDLGEAWIRGAGVILVIQICVVLSGAWLYPRLASITATPRRYRLYGVSLLSVCLIGLIAYCNSSSIIKLTTIILYSIVVLTLAQGGQRWLMTHLASINPHVRSTWLSVGEVFGLLTFGLISGLSLALGKGQYFGQILMTASTFGAALCLVGFRRGGMPK